MLNSQASILERLQQLQVSEEIQEFISDIMNFYKSHIGKLQQIIIQKQTQIDDIYNMKDNNEDYNKRFEEELEILKDKNRELIEENIQVIKEKEEMRYLIQSQQDDLANIQFDIKVKDDDLKNFQNRLQMLQKQNDMLLKENLNLKNNNKDFSNNRNDTNYQELIQEIMELKYQLKNQSKNFNMTNSFVNNTQTELNYQTKPRSISPEKRLQSVSIEKNKDKPERHYQKHKTTDIQNQFQSSTNNPLQNQQKQDNRNERYETEEIEVEKLNEYLQFLQQKEKQLQNDLWKYPARPRIKMDKEAKKQIEQQLEEVIQEIHSIKHTLKNKSNQKYLNITLTIFYQKYNQNVFLKKSEIYESLN